MTQNVTINITATLEIRSVTLSYTGLQMPLANSPIMSFTQDLQFETCTAKTGFNLYAT